MKRYFCDKCGKHIDIDYDGFAQMQVSWWCRGSSEQLKYQPDIRVDDLPDLKRGEPIVRCRDCKYMFDWAYDRMLCKMWSPADIDEPEGDVLYPCVKPDGFCAWGERRDA